MEVMVQNPWIQSGSKLSYDKDPCLKLLADKVAALELREDQHTKDECLWQLREWIKQNPDIKDCITGIWCK